MKFVKLVGGALTGAVVAPLLFVAAPSVSSMSAPTSTIAAAVTTASEAAASTLAPPTPADVDAALASAGITVVESTASVVTGMAVTTVERDSMVDEVIGGSGIVGVDLDAVTPMPEGAPPFSFLVAAWLHDTPTETARLARAWYPSEVDWSRAPSIAFPRAVLLLFAVDVANDADANLDPLPPEETFVVPSVSTVAAAADTADVTAAGLRAAGAVGAVCASISGFFTNQVTQLFNKLRLRTDFAGGGVLGFVGSIVATLWNTAVALASSVVQGLVRNLGQPVLEAIGKAIAVAGLISHVSSYVRGWKLQLVAKPDLLPFAVADGPDQAGVFEVTVDSSSRPWQPDLEQCARAFNITLPKVLEPGSAVRWEQVTNIGMDGRAPMIIEQSHDDTVPGGGQPAYRFVTGREETAEGDLLFGESEVIVRVGNDQLRPVLELAKGLIGQTVASIVTFALPVPELAGPTQAELDGLLQPAVDQLAGAINNGTRSVFEMYGRDRVIVLYHHKRDEPATLPDEAGDGNRDAFCAAVRAFPGAQADAGSALADFASMGSQGLEFVAGVEPITPAEMTDEVAALRAMYTSAADVDLAGIGANAEAFGNAWLSIFAYCGIAAST